MDTHRDAILANVYLCEGATLTASKTREASLSYHRPVAFMSCTYRRRESSLDIPG